jgi:hypothetical protein
MSSLNHPCLRLLNEIVARQGSRKDLTDELTKRCQDKTCPVHRPGGIASPFLEALCRFSDAELAELLRMTMQSYG